MNNQKSLLVTAAFWFLSASTAWAAQAPPEAELEVLKRMMHEIIAENQKLAERVRELEAELVELKAVMAARGEGLDTEVEDAADAAADAVAEPPQEPVEERGRATGHIAPELTPLRLEDAEVMINEYVAFGGALEIEGDWRRNFDHESESNIRLETAEFDFEAQIVDWVTGTLQIEWDDEDDKLTVDEAFLQLGNTKRYPPFLLAGRFVVPFGLSTGDRVGDTLSITDPLTFEVFETREDTVLLGAEAAGFVGGAYAFNGDTNEGGGDHVGNFGATIGYAAERGDMEFTARVDFINSVFDSDGLTEAFPDALEADYTPGLAALARLRMGAFSISTEYNGALRDADFVSEGEPVNRRPEAWYVEGAYFTGVYGKESFVALGYSESDDLGGAFAKRRITTTIGSWLTRNLRLSLEYLHEDDFSQSQGGTGNPAQAFTGQLTYEW